MSEILEEFSCINPDSWHIKIPRVEKINEKKTNLKIKKK